MTSSPDTSLRQFESERMEGVRGQIRFGGSGAEKGRPAITINTDVSTSDSGPPSQLFDSPTSLSDEDESPELFNIQIGPAHSLPLRGPYRPRSQATLVPRLKPAATPILGPLSAPPTEYGGRHASGPRLPFSSHLAEIQSPPAESPLAATKTSPGMIMAQTGRTTITFASTTFSSHETPPSPPASTVPDLPVTPPPTSASAPTGCDVSESSSSRTEGQLVLELQQALERDPMFFYTVKGVLGDYQERFGRPSGWTFSALR
ncbi:hypothetical protein T439DRAFT_381290 [Meredithblackwellia eburnea MCA 4105]